MTILTRVPFHSRDADAIVTARTLRPNRADRTRVASHPRHALGPLHCPGCYSRISSRSEERLHDRARACRPCCARRTDDLGLGQDGTRRHLAPRRPRRTHDLLLDGAVDVCARVLLIPGARALDTHLDGPQILP